jgi:hypothetical protein
VWFGAVFQGGKDLMKELPVLFKGEMVRAILDGRKTQTRRVVKPQPARDARDVMKVGPRLWHIGKWEREGVTSPAGWAQIFKCPFGDPGDRLWVRETWKPGAWRDDGRIAIDYKASPELTKTPWLRIPNDDMDEKFSDYWHKWSNELQYAGIEPDDDGYYLWEPGKSPLKWKPSIFMPRWASRIMLEVVSVRVERLLEITPGDAKAEGIEVARDAYKGAPEAFIQEVYVRKFAKLWDKINAKRGLGWDVNPWVWVVEFRRI